MTQPDTETMDAVATHLCAAAEALQSLEGDDRRALPLRMELARCLMTIGMPAGAGDLAQSVLDHEPGNFGALLMRIDSAIETGDTDEALAACEIAMPLFPTRADYLRKKVVVLKRGDRVSDATSTLEELHEIEPGDAGILVDLGRIHAAGGDHIEAKRSFLRALTIDRSSKQAWLGLINAAAKIAGPMEARESAEQALAALPDELAIVDRAARARMAAGHHEDARVLLEKAIGDMETPPLTLRIALATANRRLGAFDAAEEQLALVLASDPRNADAWVGRIHAALEQGDFDLALETCSEAMSACPDRPDIARQRAEVLRRAGLSGDAVATLEVLHRRYPDDHTISLSLAGAFRQVGRTDEADSLFERILRDDPANWAALQGRVAIAEGRGDLELALKLLDGIPSGAQ